jgi:hypothetical protein
MLVKSMSTSGPPVAILALLGLVIRWRGRIGWLVPAVYGLHLLTHTLIFVVGAYASGGYPRFLVTTSPAAAICAVAALDALLAGTTGQRRRILAGAALVVVAVSVGLELETRVVDEAWIFLLDKVRPFVWLTTAVVLVLIGSVWWRSSARPGPALAVVAALGAAAPLAVLVRPHGITEDARAMRSAAVWLGASPYRDAPAIATNIWASHFLDRGHNVVPPPSTEILDDVKPGTVFIWDANHAVHGRFEISAESMARRPEWTLLWESTETLEGIPAGRIYTRRLTEPRP